MVKARTLWPGVESPPAPTGQGAEHPVYPCQSNCISSPDCHLLNDPSNKVLRVFLTVYVMKTFRNLLSLTVAFTFSLAPLHQATAAEATTTPVGFITTNIKGDSAGTGAFTLMGISLFKPVEFQGVIDSVNGSVVTDTDAQWTDDQWNDSYYFELFSSDTVAEPNAGLIVTITDTTTNTITLSTDVSAVLASGQAFRIRLHHTLASLFGSDNAAGFKSATSPAQADEVTLFDPASQSSVGYFYSTFGESKWRPVGDALFGDANNVIVHPDAGIIIKRKDPSDLPVKILGTVKEGATSLSVVEGFITPPI